ncbi:hypothetical protein [Limnobacter sp.]|uniref:hypothetical protein n=1 Tax=Limnobacter sp. TaxID=2003368 RepID=UPI00311F193D
MNQVPPIVQIQVRNVYGIPKIYPVNKAAQVFANIAGKKTLDEADLANIKALGFLVVEIPLFAGVAA